MMLAYNGEIDAIEFGKDIKPSDLELRKEGIDLYINIKGATDSLTIQWWFAGSYPSNIAEFRFADGTILSRTEFESLLGYNVYGTSGNDYPLYGTNFNDTMYGYEGDDILIGGNGNDILDGGAGNDLLQGDRGNDTYKFGIGDGQDTISDGYYGSSTDSSLDAVELGAGITPSDLELIKENYDLRINIKGTTDSLVINNWFGSNWYKIEQFRFADGTVLTSADVDAIGYKVYGTANNDAFIGSTANDEMYGYDGNDQLNGLDGNDTISGGAGDDILSGDNGNDTLDGGTGNDTLFGGIGGDTYKFNIGSGQDTINDSDSTIGNTDTVEFGAGITASDMELVKDGFNLKINIKGTTDSLIIQNWFYGDANKIEQFKFADGTVLTSANLDTIGYKVYGTANVDSLQGSNGNDTMYGYEGNDTLQGNAGNDVIDGGAGNDTLSGGTGNDLFLFSRGGGQDTVNAYDATVGKVDAVQFASDILPTDITVKRAVIIWY